MKPLHRCTACGLDIQASPTDPARLIDHTRDGYPTTFYPMCEGSGRAAVAIDLDRPRTGQEMKEAA